VHGSRLKLPGGPAEQVFARDGVFNDLAVGTTNPVYPSLQYITVRALNTLPYIHTRQRANHAVHKFELIIKAGASRRVVGGSLLRFKFDTLVKPGSTCAVGHIGR
jgi:hypothetical protein